MRVFYLIANGNEKEELKLLSKAPLQERHRFDRVYNGYVKGNVIFIHESKDRPENITVEEFFKKKDKFDEYICLDTYACSL